VATTRKWNPAAHPRDSKGRFTQSVTRTLTAAEDRLAKELTSAFDEHQIDDPKGYHASLEPDATPERVDALWNYINGGYAQTNEALRAGEPDQNVAELDGMMAPLPDDIVVTRQVSQHMFGGVPIDRMAGLKVRDAAYSSTSLQPVAPADPTAVTMHISASAGTQALAVPGSPEGELLLARDTELAITSVEPNSTGGFDMHMVVLAKSLLKKAAGSQTALELGVERVAVKADQPAAAATDPLTGVALGRLTDQALADLFTKHADDPHAAARLIDEMERRDSSIGDSGAFAETPEQLKIDELIAQGWDYRDAYAEVHNLSDTDLARQEQAAAVDAERRAGETREQAVRRLYSELVHSQWLEAEDATRGHLLSKAGTAAGVSPLSLFSGPSSRARKYASEDLLRWWGAHPRVTYAEFKADTLGRASDKVAAEKTRLSGNDKDFGV